MTDRRSLLLVHAHPDDESITTGATMARYAADGARVTLVTCTLGEEGEVIGDSLQHLAADADDTLGAHRIGELDAACRVLGVADHRFLGGPGRFRDSGMAGTPSSENPASFWQADTDAAAELLAAIVREVRPDVLVTYDAQGGYGHPDHIKAHRVALRASDLAAQPAADGTGVQPWQVRKVYAIAQPRAVLEARVARAQADPGPFTPPDGVDAIAIPTPDASVTARIDAADHWPAKAAAMAAHATQVTVDGERFALSNGIAQEIDAVEYYTLLRGPAPDGVEDDLFG
ncbi:N-acetyl-1-D-myo-inositol-2-amino-2-deoxy-alpha-D-glucopyranoside deacetylase [Nocardiopsis coralliicola]